MHLDACARNAARRVLGEDRRKGNGDVAETRGGAIETRRRSKSARDGERAREGEKESSESRERDDKEDEGEKEEKENERRTDRDRPTEREMYVRVTPAARRVAPRRLASLKPRAMGARRLASREEAVSSQLPFHAAAVANARRTRLLLRAAVSLHRVLLPSPPPASVSRRVVRSFSFPSVLSSLDRDRPTDRPTG